MFYCSDCTSSGQSCNWVVSRCCCSRTCPQANVLINVLVWAKVLFDSYEFKVSGFTRYGRTNRVWPTLELCGSGRASPPSPSGVAKRTQSFYRRGGECWVSVSHKGNTYNYTPQPPALLTPHPSAPVSIMSQCTPHSFKVPPLSSSCRLMAQCAPRPFVLCFTAVNVTRVTLSLLSTECALFSLLWKRPLLAFHAFLF